MARLSEEARMAIEVPEERGATGAAIARLPGASDGPVRQHVRGMKSGAVVGRSAQAHKAAVFREAIEHWRRSTEGSAARPRLYHTSTMPMVANSWGGFLPRMRTPKSLLPGSGAVMP